MSDPARLASLARLRAVHARAAELELRELEVREQIRALDWQVARAARRMRRVEVIAAEREAHLAAAASLGLARREHLDLVARRRQLATLMTRLTNALTRPVGP